MKHTSFLVTAAFTAAVNARTLRARNSTLSLADVCTVPHVQAALPANGTILGLDLLSKVTATAVYNSSSASGSPGISSTSSSANYPYCNVTITYIHPGKENQFIIEYAFPQPSDFRNRFYVAGGGGYELSTSNTGGLEYGAVGGITSAGYDAFSNSLDEVVLTGNGSINWDNVHAFSYQALGEMTVLGKAIVPSFYGTSEDTKVYTYFEGCSDGGRQGMSQVQRWGAEYDGVITGAPAFRQAQQQVLHVFSSEVEHTLNYYPPPCALEKIVNATIVACDPLDGRTDGVVSRTDLCQLNFNLSSIIGESYYCAAENNTSMGFGTRRKRQAQGENSQTTYQPAQNGTVNSNDVAVAQTIYDGIFNSQGERAYLSWQIAASLPDATTEWDNTTESWALDIPSIGGFFITKFVELVNLTNLDNLDNVTYDTLVDWMKVAYVRYLDTLQTTYPDLSDFQSHGGKLLHYHGESDNSIPTASSVHYWQSVRDIMYPNITTNDTAGAISDWYQLYLIPGAAHCSVNTLQPGPYPYNNMNTMIDWVENGVTPTRLNATVKSGSYAGETQWLCQWPERPLWSGNSSDFECVTDAAGYATWTYDFSAFKVPVY